jgi:tetratricopeptide (TPR) repeat protein
MGEADVSQSSSKVARAQEVAALKGLRAAVPLYVDATDALAAESRWEAAVSILAEVLNTREKKRSLFGSKEVNPLGPDRAVIGKQFAKLSRHAEMSDSILELLGSLATENPDDPVIRLANAEGLYRGAYMADAIDEYRYCEKLIPDDGAIQARLGELYAIMSRNAEAVDYLRRGIGELMQARHFDDVPAFAKKLLEVSPQAAPDVLRWLESFPEDAFSAHRGDITNVVDRAREAGLDDARWANIEERLALLPTREKITRVAEPTETEPQVIAEYAAPSEEAAEPAAQEEAEVSVEAGPPVAEPVHASSSAWDDVSNVEPASDDEIRILFGAPAETAEARQSQPTSSNGLPAGGKQAVSASSSGYTSSVSIGSTQPTAAGGLPPGLAAFTRRKGDSAYAAGDFGGAAASYERLMKAVFDRDVATNLVECYLGLERFEDAVALGLRLADNYAEAGELDKALSMLAMIMEHTSNPAVEQRHSELLTLM